MRTRNKIILSCLLFLFIATLFGTTAEQEGPKVSVESTNEKLLKKVQSQTEEQISQKTNLLKVSKKQIIDSGATPTITPNLPELSQTNTVTESARGGSSESSMVPESTVIPAAIPITGTLIPTIAQQPTQTPTNTPLVVSGNGTNVVNNTGIPGNIVSMPISLTGTPQGGVGAYFEVHIVAVPTPQQ